MKERVSPKGTWTHRVVIYMLTVVLTVLLFWVLGFLVKDIRTIPGPEYYRIEQQHVDAKLVSQRQSLDTQIADLARQIEHLKDKQRIVGDSSHNLQQTINQLIELQKAGVQKSVAFSTEEQASFTNSMNLFLENQKKYQELSHAVADGMQRQQELSRERHPIEQEIARQRELARHEYNAVDRKHEMKLASYQLAILLPVLAAAGVLLIRQWSTKYFPLFLAFAVASLVQVGLVVHEYFPSRYFKYVLIGGLTLGVARVLIHFIRTVANPKMQWLLKQYREAYERFLCPVCEYPIRTGPRRFLFWTRRTVNRIVVPAEQAGQEEKYTCPSCGSSLFEECGACHQIRHTMLPHCAHCGAEKQMK